MFPEVYHILAYIFQKCQIISFVKFLAVFYERIIRKTVVNFNRNVLIFPADNVYDQLIFNMKFL